MNKILTINIFCNRVSACRLVVLSTLLIISGSAGTAAFAATITKIDSSKGGAYIDEGKNNGIDKGSTVCFYDSNDLELGCGAVVKASKSKAIVKLKKKKILQKLEVGMTAKVKDEDGGDSSSESKADKSSSKSKKTSMKHRRNFKAMYLLGLVPGPYKKLSYDADAKEKTYTWKDNGSNSLNISGGGAEIEFPTGPVSLSIGVKYRYFFDFISTADYGQGESSSVYVELKESGSSVGGWFDLHFFEVAMGKSTFFKTGLGLDFESTSVTLLATKKDDDKKISDTEILNAKSSLTTIGVRLPLTLTFFFDPVGIHLGVVPVVPVSGTSTLAATFESGATDDQKTETLKTALAHQKSSFGADFALGLFAAF